MAAVLSGLQHNGRAMSIELMALRATRLTVHVTEAQIEAGEPENELKCPITLALNAAGYRYVRVSRMAAAIYLPAANEPEHEIANHMRRDVYDLGQQARGVMFSHDAGMWIAEYDKGITVKPRPVTLWP